jgi:predicted ATPase/class 3 adenylate cyclase
VRKDLPTGAVTLLLTDIEGSTRLLHRLGSDGYANALETHRRMLREAFAQYQGVEVDTQGDAFFVAFPTAEGAVRAAAAAQQALQSCHWPEQAEVRVRMGVHTGHPRATEEGYVGMDVHLAARIASSGHGGQVLMSATTAALVRMAVQADKHALRDLGEHTLKDVAEPVQLYQLVQPGLRGEFSELRALTARPNNLPSQATAFVGREHLIEHLRDLVLQDDVRLVTITGPGGAGKTRSSVRVARELLQSFADGAFLVPLGAVVDADDVIPAIADALNIAEEPGVSRQDTLRRSLASKQLLLILDNFEQVMAAAGELGRLLRDCPRIKALVTSREILRLSGERVLALPPLSLPPHDARLGVAEIATFEAIALFVDRARAVRADFVLDADNLADVIDICRQLDGLPLAIELAAPRIRTMDPLRLRRALQRRLKVLTGGAADLLDHQRTLRDLIAWSYDLLSRDEKTLWRRLAVFVEGATTDTAQAVCDLEGDIDVEIDIDALAAKSLVRMQFDARTSGIDKVVRAAYAEPRIMLLNTLREFALEALEQAGERIELEARHREFFLCLAEQAEPALRTAHAETWVPRLNGELGNLRAAFESCLTHEPEAALRFAAALWFYMYESGRLTEGHEWLQAALDRATQANPALRARAYLGLAGLHRQQNRLDAAEHAAASALELSRAAADRDSEASAVAALGAIAQRAGNDERAAEHLEAAATLLRELDNRERLSFTLVALGALHHVAGRLDEARLCYQESHGIARALGDRHAIATATVNLGEVEELRGNHALAADLYKQSLAIYSDLNMPIAIAYCLEVLAPISLREGDPAAAAFLFGHAQAIRERIDAPVESFNVERYQRDVMAVRNSMDAAEFDRCWQQGALTPTHEAVPVALGVQLDRQQVG